MVDNWVIVEYSMGSGFMDLVIISVLSKQGKETKELKKAADALRQKEKNGAKGRKWRQNVKAVEKMVLTAGATPAVEILSFCLADTGNAFLVPSPYYPG
ncbi:hypothetical protein C5167_005580 [Papaver somniferum]|uniref:Aminotransferase class I/classII large domain-containing protein n=1 Tax=Papaver somniferum TaxID=3469 RepID=A0A4Y7JAW5_PAPSO|nr:hypothetical protein C5167_005580 [Papaver somniferum]